MNTIERIEKLAHKNDMPAKHIEEPEEKKPNIFVKPLKSLGIICLILLAIYVFFFFSKDITGPFL